MRYLVLLLALALCAIPPCAAQSFFATSPPFKIYANASGQPLNNGFIRFGVAGQNPETNPITVYWDAAGTIPAAQPIRTINGFPARYGTPTNVFAASDHSISVRDAKGQLVYTASQSTDILLAGAILGSAGGAVNIGITDAGGFFVSTNVEGALQELAAAATIRIVDAGGVFASNNVEGALQEPVGLNRLASEVLNLLIPTGTVLDYVGSGAAASNPPALFVFADSRTIGNASSNATGRANADTLALFTLLWDNFTNTELPIQDSAGSPTTRGANAAADFAANKRLPTPDLRGRVTVGRDNMGNSTAGRVTVAGGNFDGTVIGRAGGGQNHQLTSAQMPSHTHTQNAHNHSITDPGHNHTDGGHVHQVPSGGSTASLAGGGVASITIQTATNSATGAANLIANTTSISINNATAVNQSTGGDGTHPNVQPSIVVTKIIKLVVAWEHLQ